MCRHDKQETPTIATTLPLYSLLNQCTASHTL